MQYRPQQCTAGLVLHYILGLAPPIRKCIAKGRADSIVSGSIVHLAHLMFLLGGDGFGANDIAVREHPSKGWGVYASRDLAVYKTGGRK